MQEKIKTYILICACGVFFGYLFYSLYNLQIVKHKEYLLKKEKQNQIFNVSQKRGIIYATNKNGELAPLAVDELRYKLIISPKDIPDNYENRLHELLTNIIQNYSTNPDLLAEYKNLEKSTFLKKLENKKGSQKEIAVIDEKIKEKINELNIMGVHTSKYYQRTYPLKEVSAKLVGFVGDGEDGVSGKYALEKYYENDLLSGSRKQTNFFTEIFKNKQNMDTTSVRDIVTTIEPNVSKFLYNLLEKMQLEWKADIVAAIIMKVDTGEIIAMEALPTFDPNKYSKYKIESFSNPSINGVYEMGSIMKPITIAAGINENLITPTTTYFDAGFVKVDSYTIKNFDEKARGQQTMQQVISSSLNTGAVFVQQKLGNEKFRKYFYDFGLKDNTEIDFPNEANNLVSNLESNIKVNFATASFGQGVAVTPISMLVALNVIVNKGKKVCPHFLKYKLHHDNTKIYFQCNLIEKNANMQIITEETADIVKHMLIELIESGLAGGQYRDKNYLVGAKTGTAQLPSPDGKYYKDKFLHSYYTFFPSKQPEFSILIYQVNPKQGALASLTLAPYATKLKNFLLNYYNIPPDR